MKHLWIHTSILPFSNKSKRSHKNNRTYLWRNFRPTRSWSTHSSKTDSLLLSQSAGLLRPYPKPVAHCRCVRGGPETVYPRTLFKLICVRPYSPALEKGSTTEERWSVVGMRRPLAWHLTSKHYGVDLSRLSSWLDQTFSWVFP